jgi:hypothetical protein
MMCIEDGSYDKKVGVEREIQASSAVKHKQRYKLVTTSI